MSHDPHQLRAEVLAFARRLGFDRAGIAPAGVSAYRQFLREWLDEDRAGEMTWLARRFEQRTDPAAYLPGCRSVICLAVNYHTTLPEPDPAMHRPARVARYALGDDYHQPLKDRLYQLADWLRTQVPGTRTRCGVDTVPVLERELAARAGLGWIGKNTCLIDHEIGSWLLLAEVLTTLELPTDQPVLDRCGTCTRCLEACPTRALEPYRIDARRCLSYQNIERPGGYEPALAAQAGDWLFGCDICQDVCPFNRRAPQGTTPELQPRPLLATGRIDLQTVLGWSPGEYQRALRRSPLRRVKLPVLQRNAAALGGRPVRGADQCPPFHSHSATTPASSSR
jgi:epoxyqueuosine reductase